MKIKNFIKDLFIAIVSAIVSGWFGIFIGEERGETNIEQQTINILIEAEDDIDSNLTYDEKLSIIAENNKATKEENVNLLKRIDDLIAENENLNIQISQYTSSTEINKIIKEAEEYWDAQDYIQCLLILKNSIAVAPEIQELYKTYADEYCSDLIWQADVLVMERSYDEAISLLESGKKIINDSRLNDKILEINQKYPIKLSQMKIVDSRFFEINQNSSLLDTVGNRYLSEDAYIMHAEGVERYGYGSFYLGGKHTGFIGKISVSEESEKFNDDVLEGWVEIYSKTGSEYTLLWTSPMLSRMIDVIEIPELNLTNAEWLEVRFFSKENYYSFAYGDHSLEVIVSEGIIYSD